MKAIRTWIVIADAARARILLHEGAGHGLQQIPDYDFRGIKNTAQDIQADRPGRSFDSAGEGRHAMEPHSDSVREEKKRFVAKIADLLDEQLGKKAYDRLIIVAAPEALGDLRAAFSAAVTQAVYAELPKDLTKVPNDKLESHLQDTLAV